MRVMELLKTTEAFFTRTRTENFFLPQVKEILAEPAFLPRMIGWFRLFRTLTMLLSEDFTVYRGVPRIPTMPLLSRSISVPRMQLTEETRLLMVEDWTLTVKVADRPYPFVRVILLVPTFFRRIRWVEAETTATEGLLEVAFTIFSLPPFNSATSIKYQISLI